MKTANQILSELGIEASHSREGSQSTKCPACSHTRKKRNAKCMKVTIDKDGVRWFCHHCSDHGGSYYDNIKSDYKMPAKRQALSLSAIRSLRNA